LTVLLVALTWAAAQPSAEDDPDPKDLLKKSCGAIAALRSFTLETDETHELVSEDGRKYHFGQKQKIACRRPNALTGLADGDMGRRRIVYDGAKLSILDLEKNVYSVVDVPNNLDEMIEHMHEKYGAHPPLADLFFADPFKAIGDQAQEGVYVGLHTADGTKCHHIAFSSRVVDWEVWVDAGAQPLPRKLAMTQKTVHGTPQFTFILRWDTRTPLGDDLFRFAPPAGASKIPYLPQGGPAPGSSNAKPAARR
jgi:hypothetical protein